MVDSNFVYEEGDPVDIGSHGQHDYVFSAGEKVNDVGLLTQSANVCPVQSSRYPPSRCRVNVYPFGAEVGSRITRDDGFSTVYTRTAPYWFLAGGEVYGGNNTLDNVVFYNKQLTDEEIQSEAAAFGF